MKKQIVFVEHPTTTYTYKIARSLKLTGRYETVLITFSKIDKSFLSKAYDKIFNFELSHKINLKNLLRFPRQIISKEFKNFLKNIRSLNPYIFQITGPDLFTTIFMFFMKEKPKVYFAYDFWAFNDKKFALKNIQIKEFFQKRIEKLCLKKADGILHKSAPQSLDLLGYKISAPVMSTELLCLDEQTIPPNKKKDKEIHIAYAGSPLSDSEGKTPFLRLIRGITSQKIHFHTYGKCSNKQQGKLFGEEARKNKYFHMHDSTTNEELKKELSKYNYGFVPTYSDISIINMRLPETSVANKMFDYIEAGIPALLLGIRCEFAAQILEKDNIGMFIGYNDLKNLKRILNNKDYKNFQKNIKKAQEENRLSKKIKDFEKFYEVVAGRE